MEVAHNQDKPQKPDNFLSGGGEMGARIRAFDWSETPIGPISSWSPSLKMMVRLLLANRFPMLLWWGPQFIQIYNDPYRPVLGAKHPELGLGRPVYECWAEIWHILRPLVETPFGGGPSTWMEDIQLELNRFGFVEETHFTIAYSPVPDETVASGIGGVLATVHEITGKVVGERRVTVLRDLGAKAIEAKTAEEACAVAAETLTKHPYDVPFALFYLIDPDGKRARLTSAAGIMEGGPASPLIVDLTTPGTNPQAWPLAEAVQTESLQFAENLSGLFGEAVPPGPWGDPPQQAAVVPIRSNIAHQLAGILIVGISSRLRFDDSYRSFIELATSQIATAIANARAYEEEKRRAEALAEIDRAKTAFFSNVSHEFRTPLALMLGPLEDVISVAQDPAQKAELEVVHRNGLRLLKLVNTLLDFSRIEAGRVQAKYEPTDLATLTAELASVFRSAIERAGLQLIINCPSLSEPVYVDREMWEKIVLNLLSNAFKFTFEGAITVSLRPALDGGGAVELEVQDSGTGIVEAELSRLFERFHRVRGAQSRSHEGSGIGLALVRELVKLHGGSVGVESEVGKGTTFTISIPTGSAHLPADRISAERTLSSTTLGSEAFVEEALGWLPGGDFELPILEFGLNAANASPTSPDYQADKKQAKILLADDNADMREYVKRILSRHWTVEAVADGRTALEAARERLPNLVLTDVMMPGLDGFELLHELRADPRTRDVPVILLSARAGEEARIEGLEAGADDYLTKPFGARELVARISAHLEMARVRRETTQAVRESEERLRTLVTATSDVVYRMSADWSDMLSLQGRDILSDTKNPDRSWLEKNIHPDDQPQIWVAIQEAIRTKSAFELEHRVIRDDGTLGWTLSRAIPVFDARGEIVEWFGAASDVTERKQAEEVKAYLAAIVESSDDAIISKNLQGIITSWNNGAEKMFGYTAAEAVGRSITMLIPSQYLDEEPQILEKIRRGEIVDHFETVRQRKDGTTLDISLTISPIRDDAGTIIGASKIARDISERHRAEEVRRASAAQLLTLFDEAPLGIYLVDGDFRVRQVNPTALLTFGEIPDLIGREFDEVIHILWSEEYADEIVRLFRHTLETGEPYFTSERIEVRLDSGVTEYYEWQVNRIPLPEGGYGVVCYFRDISAQVFARLEREKLLAAEREAREAADAASLAKDEFLATVSHELRSPLNAMLGWARLLSSGQLPEESTARGLKSIEQNAKAQAQLIEDLLDVSRITSGKFRLQNEPVRLARVIEAAIDSIRPTAETKGVTLLVTLDPDAGPVLGDAGRLQQIVWNLLSNAVKFTPKGGRVQVGLLQINSHIEIVVGDTGQGIEPEFLPFVFERFRQADGSTTRAYGGLGLGLAIVRHITELHGGSVAAESPGKGQGATFTVQLPLMVIHTKERDRERFHPRVSTDVTLSFQPSLTLEGIKVLVVDDEPETLLMLSTVLTQSGAYVKTASSAAEGFQAVQAWRPNVLVSDIGMPTENGYDFMKRVKTWSRENGAWVPAIALTAYARTEDRINALSAGFQIHITKPVEPAELIMVIGSLVERPPNPQ